MKWKKLDFIPRNVLEIYSGEILPIQHLKSSIYN